VSNALIVITVVLIALVALAALRIEPHWCSKDGQRMIARAQLLPDHHQPSPTWNEVRLFVDEDNILVRTRGRRASDLRGDYKVVGKSPSPPKKREIYILKGDKDVCVRIPTDSRAIATFEELLSRPN
jgi:hypothetical protein